MRSSSLIIRGLATVSPLGSSADEVSESLRRAQPAPGEIGGSPVFRVTASGERVLEQLAKNKRYASLDRATLLALAAAKQTIATLPEGSPSIGCVSIGSARGATTSLEKSVLGHACAEAPLAPDTSPNTTAGNISSWVAQAVAESRGPQKPIASLGTSMTCTSALHSLLIAKAFIDSGMADSALFGGAEACLTPYTLAQLSALRIYTREKGVYPCMPCLSAPARTNSVTLGEGSGTAILQRRDESPDGSSPFCPGDMQLLGIGWSLEAAVSATGISEDGDGLEAAMRQALSELPPGRKVDAVVLHAPGTAKGDAAELSAVARLLGDVPVCSSKHLTGHTYGASGMLSLCMAQWLLNGGGWAGFPYPSVASSRPFEAPSTVLINAAGFGGNSISMAVGLPDGHNA